jgi:hypothetical protein
MKTNKQILTKNQAANELIYLGQRTEKLEKLLEAFDEIDGLIYGANGFSEYHEIKKSIDNVQAELEYIFRQYQKHANELATVLKK